MFRPFRPSAGSRVIEKAGAGFWVGLGFGHDGVARCTAHDPK